MGKYKLLKINKINIKNFKKIKIKIMLRIISYNIRGITTCKKQQLFKIWLNQNPHDIVMLRETHDKKFSF
jgi:hypothetical protein